jgi:hypothetical protein
MVGTLRFAHPTNLCNDQVASPLRHINPTGKSIKNLSIPSRENIALAPSGKSVM